MKNFGLGVAARAVALVVGIAWANGCEDPYEVELDVAASEMSWAYCATLFSCECRTKRFGSESACRRAVVRDLRRFIEDGKDSGLQYDPSCFGELQRRFDEQGCETGAPIDERDCARPCSPFHGGLGVGEDCYLDQWGFNECAQGLTCVAGRCTDPCAPQEGAQRGRPCDGEPCGAELYCDPDDLVCRPHPDVGQPCEQAPCRAGSFCDQIDPADALTWRCAALRQNAEPCTGHGQCASLHCPAGWCMPRPQWGEVCPAGICGEGLACQQGFCRDEQPPLCGARPAPIPG